MPGKTAGPPQGLRSQIDELDALLDRLLQLPLGPAPSTPSSPTLKLAQPGDSLLDVMDEALELNAPILRIPTHDDEAKTAVDDAAPSLRPVPIKSEFGTFPLLPVESATDESASPAILPLTEHVSVNRLEEREIPWLDDEPAASAPDLEPTPARQISPLAGAARGPRVEIVQGSLNTLGQSLASNVEVPDEPYRPGMVRGVFLVWNWLFDYSVGLLLPGLRRRGGKRVLAVLGMGLLAASAFLAWRWWVP
jgi:hypothetical protein